MLERLRFVLVRPMGPANVGSVCRAMVNMGLSDLVLVSPQCDLDHEHVRAFAMRGKSLLERTRVVETIDEALAGCVKTYATSAKGGMYRRQAAVTAAVAADEALEVAGQGPVAFVFGPEDRGLVMHEILNFDRVVEIPADPAYPVLNLAAAVMVIAYELRQAWFRRNGEPPIELEEPLATDDRKRILYRKLFDALEEIGFFGGQQSPDHLRFALRRVFGRLDMSVNEVDILIGMAQQIRWYADHYPET